MPVRDAVEYLIRSWDAHEKARGAKPVIDYDCAPTDDAVTPAGSRLDVLKEMTSLHARAQDESADAVHAVTGAHAAYLRHLLGERWPLTDYVTATQGCPATGWTHEHTTEIGRRLRSCLDDLGITWGPATMTDLEGTEKPLTVQDACEQIHAVAAAAEPAVRDLTGTTAPYTLTVETVDVDDYWSYWLDGEGSRARLRFNTRHGGYTDVLLRQFALHEILGHALQCATYAERCARTDVDWVRLLSVNLPHQTMLEGLAQALPLMATPDDTPVTTRVRLHHYLQLVRAELHLMINDGVGVTTCAHHARTRVPWWSTDDISDTLADRSTNPLLRSYLWAYPAGIDWFTTLADTADPTTIHTVMHAAYQQPLTPADLRRLWPDGPAIGGTLPDPN
jgi:hypothetical protein